MKKYTLSEIKTILEKINPDDLNSMTDHWYTNGCWDWFDEKTAKESFIKLVIKTLEETK